MPAASTDVEMQPAAREQMVASPAQQQVRMLNMAAIAHHSSAHTA